MQETTPAGYRCATGFCPSTFDLGNGKVLIIGKKVDAELLADLSGRIGDDEYAIVVEAGLLQNVIVPK